MADKQVMLTEEGYNKLVEKLNYLKSVKRIEIAERLKAAIALGDLSENSEYDDAKNEQAFLEGEIQDLTAKIRNSHIIKAGAGDIVQMGSKVTVKDIEFGDEDTFMLVGSTEADPDEGKISNGVPARSGTSRTEERQRHRRARSGRHHQVRDPRNQGLRAQRIV